MSEKEINKFIKKIEKMIKENKVESSKVKEVKKSLELLKLDGISEQQKEIIINLIKNKCLLFDNSKQILETVKKLRYILNRYPNFFNKEEVIECEFIIDRLMDSNLSADEYYELNDQANKYLNLESHLKFIHEAMILKSRIEDIDKKISREILEHCILLENVPFIEKSEIRTSLELTLKNTIIILNFYGINPNIDIPDNCVKKKKPSNKK